MAYIEAREIYRDKDHKLHQAIDEAVNGLNRVEVNQDLWGDKKKEPFDWKGLICLLSPFWMLLFFL